MNSDMVKAKGSGFRIESFAKDVIAQSFSQPTFCNATSPPL